FPGTAAARRLRRGVLEGTHFLQRDSGDRLPSLRRCLVSTFPRTFRALLPVVGVVTWLFTLAALLGFSLTAVDPTMATLFLPAESIAGLARGELWTDSIFAVTPNAAASARIATNNLSVAITAWAGGAVAGLGAIYVVLVNGIMLGSVIAMTERYSMAGSLLDFIAAHGPLEITMILVSAAAGLHMGRALVFAGDLPRARALAKAGRESLVILAGCLPFILILGFVEGFISPSRTPIAAKAALGWLLEGLFLLWALGTGRAADGPQDPLPEGATP
ncbi:MAG: stage II sporulation protein M, partial [Acidobacteriota bacterium]